MMASKSSRLNKAYEFTVTSSAASFRGVVFLRVVVVLGVVADFLEVVVVLRVVVVARPVVVLFRVVVVLGVGVDVLRVVLVVDVSPPTLAPLKM